jgi:hypothetical protein
MATVVAQGSKFSATISGVLTEIGGRISISPPKGSKPEIKITTLGSTAQEYAGGLPDLGEVSVEYLLDPQNATHAALLSWFIATSSAVVCKIELPDGINGGAGSTFNFSAFPKGFEPNELTTDEIVSVTLSFKVSGSVTFTPAS